MVAFIESLPVTAGTEAGKNFRLRPWQKKIIRGIYGPTRRGRRVVKTALLTLGRKNGKTGLAAVLALAHLVGPAVESRGQIYSAACDKIQAALIYDEMEAIIQRVDWMAARCNIQKHYRIITDQESGTVYRALSADAKKAHRLSPSLVIADELAQWRHRELWDNLVTGTGARAEPLILAVGTQAATDDALFSELVDYGAKVNSGEIKDPTFYAAIYITSESADIWDEASWYAANPALGDFRSLQEMRDFAAQAQRMPTKEAAFRNLYLNQRVDSSPSFIRPADWKACGEAVEPQELFGRPCWAGLDLSATQDLTALELFFPDDGGAVLSYFWLPAEGIRDRADQDRVPYDVWAKQGHLELTPGRAVDRGFIVRRLAGVAADYDIKAIGYDRWRMNEVKKILDEEGISLPLVEFGQGLKDMAPAIDELERLILAGKLKHGGHPVLTMCTANVKIEPDAAGNRKFSKKRSTGRIDGMVALAMAVGQWAKEAKAVAFVFDPGLPVFLEG
ncbi:MAG: terminase large subunit [Candidatus Adiutrix sp.]|jgi:phage terminase large subunit-like protein|nr:terminase large subunit [Candidatus Adiutrix sp.]